MLRTVSIEMVIKSAHAALHFACATIAWSVSCYVKSSISHPDSCLLEEAATDTKCAVFE